MIATVVNHKGGVGKTSLTVNLATALGNQGKTVLVVDNDPQSNASGILLADPNPKTTLYELLDPDSDKRVPLDNFIYHTKSRNVSILPNTDATSGLEIPLAGHYPESQNYLRDAIREYAEKNYDFTLIDCQPTLGLFVANAMITADAVIVPVDAGSSYSIDNLAVVMEMIDAVKESSNPDIKFFRMVINRVDKRTTVCQVLMNEIRQRFGKEQVFDTEIPVNTAIQQAEYAKDTIFRWDKHSTAAKAYRKLAKEVIAILNGV
ncbi:chromosome partitioning protein ParA (plasmid) [Desulfosarcina ovata subsp. sediminis]|uniref:Chromosome partitioning protein ParA n=1 Tax=Desulfosarcina ovata subsp. sediminis TaxID=885957 RepID=A0A5K8A2T2_9BACT|nr:ParA family protein [Desulfosarcina ovata]BBO86751.1 chromosome partitioning protein ParA [Desulfosarcina ovata subsp. sediminis]